MDCFQKYGKTGRSFYNSQIASTLRWLSSCSSSDLDARVPQRSAFVMNEQSRRQEITSKPGLPNPKHTATFVEPNINTADCKRLLVDTAKGSYETPLTRQLNSIDRKRRSDGAENVVHETVATSLPMIPSFSSFMMKKHKSN